MAALEIENLSFSYGGSRILWDICLNAEAGSITCLMGRNGVGKTTLLKNVIGLLQPSAGHVRVDGKELGRLPPNQRVRYGIGYVPQGREIFPHLTVLENLLLPVQALSRKSNVFGLLERVYGLFPVLKEMKHRKGGVLSGGQQQQLAIARALLTEPRVLLLDEPTEGIQPSIVHEIGESLRSLKSMSIAVLLVEQCVPFARRIADYFYLMEKGKIVVQGPIQDLTDEIVHSHLSV